MKIGILTFHNTMNYGASLQAYALVKVLVDLGYDAEIVDYRCPRVTKCETPSVPPVSMLLRHPRSYLYDLRALPKKKKRKASFELFAKKYFRMGPELSTQQKIAERFDCVVVGSDQVWNMRCSGSDNTYFLNEVDSLSTHKYSYAASFGSSSESHTISSDCIEGLRNFEMISVRERSSLSTVQELCGKEAQVTLDPTLLLGREQWIELSDDVCSDPYVFVYMVGDRVRTLQFAKKYASERGLRVVAIDCYGSRTDCSGVEYRNDASIEEFLGLISSADTVVTSSFHGMALSVAMGKNFYFALNQEKGNANSRLEDLSAGLGLSNRNIDNGPSSDSIDYDVVEEILGAERKKSIDFLLGALGAE